MPQGFNSVTVVRPFQQIVNQMQQAIHEGRLQRGARLPTERELSVTFGVSRAVVREAIKVLEAMGLVESRQGSGLYVRNDPIPSITRAFILSVSPDAESVDRLYEFRLVLEREAASLAATRRTEDDLAAIRAAIDVCDPDAGDCDWDVFVQSDFLLHKAIAHASGNPYLDVAIATARDMLGDVVRLFAESPGSVEIAVGHHLELFAAIERRDVEGAATTMDTHIGYTCSVVQGRFPQAAEPVRRARAAS